MAHVHKMPEPPGYPIIGNLTEFVTSPVKDLSRLADTYGSFSLYIELFISSASILNSVCTP